jgi:hypothetical protein
MFEKLFDFSDITNFLSTVTQDANTKAVAAQDLAKEVAVQKGKIADSAVDYNDQAQKALGRLQTIEAKGDEARRMAESGNIFDRITLIGEQILDPRNFTAEGRSRQVSEMSQTLGMHGQIHNVETNLAAAKMDEAAAQATLKTAGIDAKANMLRAQVDGLALMNQAMLQTETLRKQNLAQVDLPTIQKALMGPPNPELKGKLDIGGMAYTPVELQEREKQLTTRASLAMLTPQATDPDFAVKMRVHHDMQLANFTVPELEELRKNQYMMQDGTQVEPSLWDQHYTRQNQAEQQVLQKMMTENMLENQIPTMMKESQTMAESVGAFAAPGTPLAVARNNFLAAANGIATIAAADTTPQGKIVQVAELQKAQQGLVKAVETEAFKKAGGDKQLAEIYRDQMLGQPIQASAVEDVLRTRYTKGEGFGELLPNEASLRVRKNADTNFNLLRQKNAANLDPMAASKSAKELKEEAINMALEQERNMAGVIGANAIQKHVSQRKDNPAIVAGMVPGQLDEMQVRAHTIAMDNVAHRENLTQVQMLAIKNGNARDAGISDERAAAIGQALNAESIMTEYDLFEKQKPGLGYEMQQWYMKVMPELAQNYTLNLKPMERVLTGDSVIESARNLSRMYTMADEAASDRGRTLAAELSTGARKPENMWPVLLHTDKRLADAQKQTIFYDVINPAIEQARARGANDEVTTQAVFDALNNYKSDDPALMGSVKTMMRELPSQLDNFNAMWTYALSQNNNAGTKTGGWTLRAQSRAMQDADKSKAILQSTIPWMKKQ